MIRAYSLVSGQEHLANATYRETGIGMELLQGGALGLELTFNFGQRSGGEELGFHCDQYSKRYDDDIHNVARRRLWVVEFIATF